MNTRIAILSVLLVCSALTSTENSNAGSGSIYIDKEYCSIEIGENRCSIFLSWSTSGLDKVCLWRLGPGLDPAPNACAHNKTDHEYPWADEKGRTLELRYGSSTDYSLTTLIDSVFVWGVKRSLDFSIGVGSNYHWTQIDDSGCSENDPSSRFPYDVLSTLHLGSTRTLVVNQIDTMAQNGHDLLRIPIFYRHCGEVPEGEADYSNSTECPNRFSGSSVASDLGYLPAVALENLGDLLEIVAEKGIGTVILSGHPIGEGDAKNWTVFKEEMYLENLSTLLSTRNFVETEASSRNLPSIVWDVENELVPAANDPDLEVRLQYAQRLWVDWVREFGAEDSVGFSVTSPNSWHVDKRMRFLDDIYGVNVPDFIDLHQYSRCTASEYPDTVNCESEQEVLQAIDAQLRSMPGFETIAIGIGEGWFNDFNRSQSIAAAMEDRGSGELSRNLVYAMQWPRNRGDVFNCVQEPPYTLDALNTLR